METFPIPKPRRVLGSRKVPKQSQQLLCAQAYLCYAVPRLIVVLAARLASLVDNFVWSSRGLQRQDMGFSRRKRSIRVGFWMFGRPALAQLASFQSPALRRLRAMRLQCQASRIPSWPTAFGAPWPCRLQKSAMSLACTDESDRWQCE